MKQGFMFFFLTHSFYSVYAQFASPQVDQIFQVSEDYNYHTYLDTFEIQARCFSKPKTYYFADRFINDNQPLDQLQAGAWYQLRIIPLMRKKGATLEQCLSFLKVNGCLFLGTRGLGVVYNSISHTYFNPKKRFLLFSSNVVSKENQIPCISRLLDGGWEFDMMSIHDTISGSDWGGGYCLICVTPL